MKESFFDIEMPGHLYLAEVVHNRANNNGWGWDTPDEDTPDDDDNGGWGVRRANGRNRAWGSAEQVNNIDNANGLGAGWLSDDEDGSRRNDRGWDRDWDNGWDDYDRRRRNTDPLPTFTINQDIIIKESPTCRLLKGSSD